MEREHLYNSSYAEALSMHQQGTENSVILNYLVKAAEHAAGPGSTVSILLLDNDGLLRNGASPGLPKDYLQAIDGLKPDPKVGTCAAAAATGMVVLTPSFLADDKWSELRHLPLALGYLGAWSMPIKNNEQKVIGTFGTYFREHRQPTEEEVNGTGLFVSLVAQILS